MRVFRVISNSFCLAHTDVDFKKKGLDFGRFGFGLVWVLWGWFCLSSNYELQFKSNLWLSIELGDFFISGSGWVLTILIILQGKVQLCQHQPYTLPWECTHRL